MGIYQGLSECKPDAQAGASILAYTRLRFGLVLVRNYLPLALAPSLLHNLCRHALCFSAFAIRLVAWEPN